MHRFPYKHLIWASATLCCVFLFREPLARVIFRMQEVTILDKVSIKVSNSESAALKEAEHVFGAQIDSLSAEVRSQENLISLLMAEADKLKSELEGCDEAAETTKAFEKNLLNLREKGLEISRRSDAINATDIVKKQINPQ